MLPTTNTPTDAWLQDREFPSRLFGTTFDDYELIEEDDEFVLTVELPGYELDDITVSWDEGRLFIGAEHVDEDRGQRRTYRRSFRLPKEIEPDEIAARYRNGVLEVRLPILDPRVRGQEIEVQG